METLLMEGSESSPAAEIRALARAQRVPVSKSGELVVARVRDPRQAAWKTDRRRLFWEVQASSAIYFAWGEPDFFATRHVADVAGFPVFAIENLDMDPRDWIASESHRDLLAAIAIRAGEAVAVARNIVTATMWPHGLNRDWDRFLSLLHLVDALPGPAQEVKPVEYEEARIPPALRPLVPLIDLWAVQDDAIREDLILGASDDALDGLVGTVRPHFDAINRLLDEVGQGEEFVGLMFLGVAASEAELELGRRRRKRQ